MYPITGRKGTGVHPRRDIRDLQANHPEQFSLFILAYLAIQGRSYSASFAPQASDIPLAAKFAQLAGIHGLPYEPWSGDAGQRKADYDKTDEKDTAPAPPRFGGYCNHGSVLFPTWHRPYVLAIEQIIGDVAVELATSIEKNNSAERGRWIPAAKELRFPFWDWADKSTADEGLPDVLYTNKVKITGPNKTLVEVDNPLAFYQFDSIPDGFQDETDSDTGVTAYFSKWTRTFRYAQSTPNNKDSNIPQLIKALKKHGPDLRNKVALLFTPDQYDQTAQAWDEFSNHTTQSLRDKDFYNSGSLEGVHDQVHDIVGGNGHMADPDYAGFDPIFYLHHCNVDRILALWEYAYPEFWVENEYRHNDRGPYPFTQTRGTYWSPYNSALTSETPLAPFRTENGEYWTSDRARGLGPNISGTEPYPKYYTYPETAGVKVDQAATYNERLAARKRLQEYFGLVTTDSDTSTLSAESQAKVNGLFAVVQTAEFAFNGPYVIELNYHNPKTEDEEFIGAVAVFTRPGHSACSGCKVRRDAGSEIRGVIQIRPDVALKILANAGDNLLTTLDRDEIVRIIKSHLRSSIIDRAGKKVGSAIGGDQGRRHKASDALPTELAPRMTLHSSIPKVIPHDRDTEGELPVTWDGWKDHGSIFEGGHLSWKQE